MCMPWKASHSGTYDEQEVRAFFFCNYYDLAQKLKKESLNSLCRSKAFNQQLIYLCLFTAKVHALSKGPFQFLKNKVF